MQPTVVPRRLLCKGEPGKSDRVPRGFGNFFRHRPRAEGKEEGAAREEGAASRPGSSSSGGQAATESEAAEARAAERGEGGSASPSESGRGGAASEGSSSGSAEPRSSAGGSASGGGGGSGSGGGGGSGGGSSSGGGGGEAGGPSGQTQTTIALALAAAAVLAFQLAPERPDAYEITFAEFRRELLESGSVERIVIVNKTKARVHMRSSRSPSGGGSGGGDVATYWFSLGSVGAFEKKLEVAQAGLGVAPRDYLPVTYETETSLSSEAFKIAPTLLLIGFTLLMMRGGGMSSMMGGGGGPGGGRNIFQVGKSKPTIISKEKKTGVTFKDVAGLAEAKVEVMELVDFLKNPKRYRDLGAKIPKGAMLVGPPGTGKTLLAKATAGEANVPFLSVSGADFIEMFVGVGPSRVRDLFAQAKTMAPCIVWIDEIDAVGKSRSKGGGMGGNDERENTLNQLLVEMDGFTSSGGVVVMAGTNRPDTLDSALLRPGRFDRQIEVGAPDIAGRVEIFQVHLARLKLATEMEELAKTLSSLSPGFSGAEIANVCNEAALQAARHDKDAIDLDDFHAAMDRVIGGIEMRSKVMTVEEKTRVAHHEAGHAVVGWFLEHSSPLLKVSIVPRGMAALGYAQYVPKERKLHTKEQMVDTICMMLGGRVAELLFFNNRSSTGAQDDLQKVGAPVASAALAGVSSPAAATGAAARAIALPHAHRPTHRPNRPPARPQVTRIAYSLVTLYGMSDKIGHRSFPPPDGSKINSQRPYSEATAELVDDEVRALVNAAYERTQQLLADKKSLAAALAQRLLEKEVLHRADVVEILGERPWKDATTFEELSAGAGNSAPADSDEDVPGGGAEDVEATAPPGALLAAACVDYPLPPTRGL